MNWYRLWIGTEAGTSNFNWPDRPEFDYRKMSLHRRGRLAKYGKLLFQWESKRQSPDFFVADVGVELLSKAAFQTLVESGIRGIKWVPATVVQQDGTVSPYSLLCVPNEVERICFENEKPYGEGIHLTTMTQPRVVGLDDGRFDVYITPMKQDTQEILVNERFVQVAKAEKLSNVFFEPLADLTFHVQEPERLRCL